MSYTEFDKETIDRAVAAYIEKRTRRDGSPQSEAGSTGVTRTNYAVSVNPQYVANFTPRPITVANPVVGNWNTSGTVTARPIATNAVIMAAYLKPRNNVLFHYNARVFQNLGKYKLPTSPNRSTPVGPDVPVSAGRTLLWPNKKTREVFYLAFEPELVEMRLVVDRDANNGITGGTAMLTVSATPVIEDNAELESMRRMWRNRLREAGFGNRNWKFSPIKLTNLRAELNIQHYVTKPEVYINLPNWQASFDRIELTRQGAIMWDQAIRSNKPIIGRCTLHPTFQANDRDGKIKSHKHPITVSLTKFSENVSEEHVQDVNPQQQVVALLSVKPDPAIESITVTMIASNGQRINNEVIDENGDTLEMTLNLDPGEIKNARVEWYAKAVFKHPSWPDINVNGILSDPTPQNPHSSWTDAIKTTSWVRNYRIHTVMLDNNHRPMLPENHQIGDRVWGEILFEPDFGLEETTQNFTAMFNSAEAELVEIYIPEPPNRRSPGKLTLTIHAQREGFAGIVTKPVRVLIELRLQRLRSFQP